jgi:cellulose synthase/poly-beta-1,6-N-acetylglucosamine synthase-like glycosyltransferase
MIALLALGTVAAVLTLPGSLELLTLTLAGILPPRKIGGKIRATGNDSKKVAVVVPAHNEEVNIARTVKSLITAQGGGIQLTVVVVADNCSDSTAGRAAEAGAQVMVRHDETLRGKGYALDYAFANLIYGGFDFFVVIDADSEVSANFLTETAKAFRAGAGATQGRYIVRNSGDSVRTRLMNVALFGFNVLRPRGRDRLGISAGIYGNGFALSADTLRAVPYTAASVVEDLEYHIALVRANRKVRFVNSAAVFGDMPVAGAGVKTQRARWEGGRLRMLVEKVPLLAREVLRGRFRLTEPALDLMLLPLAFHVLLLLLALVAPSNLVRGVALAGLATVVLHLIAAIFVGGGTVKDLGILAVAPVYILWKILLIPKLIATSRSGAAWVRTERPREEKLP